MLRPASFDWMNGKKILIADDDLAIGEVVTIVLSDGGFITEVESDGNNVIKHAEKFMPDLLLLDISLGGKTGPTIVKEIKKKPKTAHIPILLVSANSDIKDIAKEAGADGFLAKPFDIDDLLAIVQKFTSQ